MKKIIVMAAIACAAIASQAASFNWAAANLKAGDANTAFSGTAYLFCEQLTSASSVDAALKNGTAIGTLGALSSVASSGSVSSSATGFSNDSLAAGNNYDFYYVLVTSGDNPQYFISSSKSIGAQASDVASISFGNQKTATSTSGSWAAVGGGDTPEPTSGLLLLVGGAMLALRRKQK